VTDKRAMVEAGPDRPSIRRQCELVALPRSTKYYAPVAVDSDTQSLMKRIDELAMEYPFWGSRNVMLQVRAEGCHTNRKRIQRLRRLMGIESVAPKPNLSQPNTAHEKYPYLLKGLTIDRADQVWATDITYIPLLGGWAYLAAIVDWYSRNVLSWRLSNTLDSRFCVDALEEALDRHGRPEIFNTDQGVQFTSVDFTNVLKANDIRISMDGKGRWLDNVFV
jgi:putative transposase